MEGGARLATVAVALALLSAPSPAHAREVGADDELAGTRFYLGVRGAGMLSVAMPRVGPTSAAEPGASAAVRFGLLLGSVELGLELSPLATFYTFDSEPNFSALLHAGAISHISGPVYWPVRFGIGALAVNTGDPALFIVRLDLFGIVLRSGPLLFELSAPSLQMTGNLDTVVFSSTVSVALTWVSGH